MINWDYAPSPDQEIDQYGVYKVSKEKYDLTGEEHCYFLEDESFKTSDALLIFYESSVYIDTNEGWGSQTEPEPPAWEPWKIETLIVRPTMKCWGRGLNIKKRGE